MIQFDFKSPSNTPVSLERAKQLETDFLNRLGDFKSQFEDAESYVEYNVDNGMYTISCKADVGDLIDRFQQYQKQNG